MKSTLTKLRYRLLADGTVIDQVTMNPVGYLVGAELEEAWSLSGKVRQKFIRDKLKI